MILSLICAMDQHRGIGFQNQLPWYLPQELKRFKEITKNHPVIMGRKTFASVINRIEKPLPQRLNIVVSHQNPQENQFAKTWSQHEQVAWVSSIDHALEVAQNSLQSATDQEVFVIGGSQIYEQTIHKADRVYLTIIDQAYQVDTFFPDFSDFQKTISQEKFQENDITYTCLVLEK